jgi:hypothetical protein
MRTLTKRVANNSKLTKRETTDILVMKMTFLRRRTLMKRRREALTKIPQAERLFYSIVLSLEEKIGTEKLYKLRVMTELLSLMDQL